MPHCVIEYSKALEKTTSPQQLVRTVHHATIQSGLFDANNVKSRALAYEHFLTGTEDLNFLHVAIKILPGRDDEQKKTLSNTVLEALNKLPIESCVVTVEIAELHGESYSKTIR